MDECTLPSEVRQLIYQEMSTLRLKDMCVYRGIGYGELCKFLQDIR